MQQKITIALNISFFEVKGMTIWKPDLLGSAGGWIN
jgi:hypothetical protein